MSIKQLNYLLHTCQKNCNLLLRCALEKFSDAAKFLTFWR